MASKKDVKELIARAEAGRLGIPRHVSGQQASPSPLARDRADIDVGGYAGPEFDRERGIGPRWHLRAAPAETGARTVESATSSGPAPDTIRTATKTLHSSTRTAAPGVEATTRSVGRNPSGRNRPHEGRADPR